MIAYHCQHGRNLEFHVPKELKLSQGFAGTLSTLHRYATDTMFVRHWHCRFNVRACPATTTQQVGQRLTENYSGPAPGTGDIGSRLGHQILLEANFREKKYFSDNNTLYNN